MARDSAGLLVDELPIVQLRLQLDRRAFETVAEPPPHGARPFGIIFTGRIERCRGVFDIVQMADILERRRPGMLRWYVLGDGTDREALLREIEARGLSSIMEAPGWIPVSKIRSYYAKAHVSIVPTRSEFIEGMAMAAIESVLAGRPVITSAVVPALEVVAPACLQARTDDVDSYVSWIERLLRDEHVHSPRSSVEPRPQNDELLATARHGLRDGRVDGRRPQTDVIDQAHAEHTTDSPEDRSRSALSSGEPYGRSGRSRQQRCGRRVTPVRVHADSTTRADQHGGDARSCQGNSYETKSGDGQFGRIRPRPPTGRAGLQARSSRSRRPAAQKRARHQSSSSAKQSGVGSVPSHHTTCARVQIRSSRIAHIAPGNMPPMCLRSPVARSTS
jgi:hypothetical protein